jgi:elongation factor 3
LLCPTRGIRNERKNSRVVRGQKVKLAIAAAFWTAPQLIVLDEPTNFSNRDALGVLSKGLNDWGGAVIMISLNRDSYSSMCNEERHFASGQVVIQGEPTEREMKVAIPKKKYENALVNKAKAEKAGGNTNTDKYKDVTVNFWGQTVSKKQARFPIRQS